MALGWHISQTKKQTRKEDQIELRKRKDGGLSLTTINKMLENTKSPKSFTRLRMSSTPREHRGFMNYLRFCKDKQFVEWQPTVALNGHAIMEYRLSERGRTFLELVG